MQLMNDRTRWGWPTRAIHWITAGILLWTMGLGIYMSNFVADPLAQFSLTQTHKSWGFLVFVLAFVISVLRLFRCVLPRLCPFMVVVFLLLLVRRFFPRFLDRLGRRVALLQPL